VPAGECASSAAHLAILEGWLRSSYRPEELFSETGALLPHLAALAPEGAARMSANPEHSASSARPERSTRSAQASARGRA
jgi:phosphoketolase